MELYLHSAVHLQSSCLIKHIHILNLHPSTLRSNQRYFTNIFPKQSAQYLAIIIAVHVNHHALINLTRLINLSAFM